MTKSLANMFADPLNLDAETYRLHLHTAELHRIQGEAIRVADDVTRRQEEIARQQCYAIDPIEAARIEARIQANLPPGEERVYWDAVEHYMNRPRYDQNPTLMFQSYLQPGATYMPVSPPTTLSFQRGAHNPVARGTEQISRQLPPEPDRSLRRCPYCGGHVGAATTTCPNCGGGRQ